MNTAKTTLRGPLLTVALFLGGDLWGCVAGKGKGKAFQGTMMCLGPHSTPGYVSDDSAESACSKLILASMKKVCGL